jgi:hypothetical protein
MLCSYNARLTVFLDDLFPKKNPIYIQKNIDYLVWSRAEGEFLMLQLDQDHSWVPILPLVHKCNECL